MAINTIKNKLKHSAFYRNYQTTKHANALSKSSKRLDCVAAQMTHLLSLSREVSLKDKVCLELGGGWVLSHAIVFFLLGAKKTIVTDIEAIAKPEFLSNSINNSSISLIRDILSPFEDHEVLRERLDTIRKIKRFNFNQLKDLGIEYRAPLDIVKQEVPGEFDFIFSNVVLEYLSEADLYILINKLSKALQEGGVMLHTVHLEDHNSSCPFNYLKPDPLFYEAKKYFTHSNRIRFNTYDNIFKKNNFPYRYLYKWIRKDVNLPDQIDPKLIYLNEEDIRISHFCVQFKK